MDVQSLLAPAAAAPLGALAGTTIGRLAERGELRLGYQPIVRTDDGTPVAVEALVRWSHPSRGLLAAETFLADLARHDELPLLDAWALRTATAEVAARPVGGPLHVNVSAARVREPGLAALVVEAARSAGLPLDAVRLEVPERLLVEDLYAALRALGELREAGVALVVDDAGTGTTVRTLRAVGARGVKVDRCYTRGLLDSGRDRAVVQRLVAAAAEAGAQVTAVGVESEAQRAALLAMGCPTVQGWLFAAAGPLPGRG